MGFSWEALSAGLEGLTHALGGGVVGFELEGGADVCGGGGGVVGLELEAGEDEVGRDVGFQLERGASFGAGFVGSGALFADLCEAGVGAGAGGVGGDGGLELLFGFGDEALGEIVAALLGVLGGLFGGREGGHAHGADLVELECGLAEGGFGVGSADSFEGFERVECGGGVTCGWW